jgi:hypothetical protein
MKQIGGSVNYRFAMYKWNIPNIITQRQTITFTFDTFTVSNTALKVAPNNLLVIDNDNKPILIQYRIVENGVTTPGTTDQVTTNWIDATTSGGRKAANTSNYQDDTAGTSALLGGLSPSSLTFTTSTLTSMVVFTPQILNKTAVVYLRIGLPMTGNTGTRVSFRGVTAKF